jgi:hypothetical protein
MGWNTDVQELDSRQGICMLLLPIMMLKLKLIYDRQSVGQCVLVSGAQFFFLLEISVRQLWVCYFVAPSLTRRRVGNLLQIASGPCQSSHF